MQVSFNVMILSAPGEVVMERGGAMEFETTGDLRDLANVVGGAAAAAAISLSSELIRQNADKDKGKGAELMDKSLLGDLEDMGFTVYDDDDPVGDDN